MSLLLKILVADDHEIFRMGLRTYFDSRPDLQLVGEARSVAEALDHIRASPPDILLLDYHLPDGTGLDVLSALRQERKLSFAVIMLSGTVSPQILADSLAAGVSALVAKRGSIDDLSNAIDLQIRQREFISPEFQAILRESEILGTLTRRENEVLLLLLTGLTLQEVADQLSVSFKTAETHKTRILQKLDVHSLQGLLARARALGLLGEL
ncbi:MAG: response regulator [Pseudomonadota bacterium]